MKYFNKTCFVLKFTYYMYPEYCFSSVYFKNCQNVCPFKHSNNIPAVTSEKHFCFLLVFSPLKSFLKKMKSRDNHLLSSDEDMETGRVRITYFSAITRNVLWLGFLSCMLFSLGFIAFLAPNYTAREAQIGIVDSKIAGAVLMALGGIGLITATLFVLFGTQNFCVSEGTVRFRFSRGPGSQFMQTGDHKASARFDFQPSPSMQL